MRRPMLFALLAAIVVAASPVSAQTATPASAPAQPFRMLASHTVSPWQMGWIGNDEKVNHCALTRGTSTDKPTPAEPKFLFIADRSWVILRLRAAEFQFTEKKPLKVTLAAADGAERQPKAATGGPDLADIRFEPGEMKSLLSSPHLDLTVEGVKVRLALDGVAQVMPAYEECMANIGTPAKGWSSGEIDQLISQVKRGKAKCVENKRTRVTMCDTD